MAQLPEPTTESGNRGYYLSVKITSGGLAAFRAINADSRKVFTHDPETKSYTCDLV